MADKRVWVIGLLCLVAGLVAGWLTTGGPAVLTGSTPPGTAPTDAPSALFSGFDPLPLVEAVSARSRARQELVTASASVSGGGLRWGQRWFSACWESRGEPREDAAKSLESQLDNALASAGVECANPTIGHWQIQGKPGAVYLVERRYSDQIHSGRLRAWLAMGERDGQVTLILTIDEP